MAVIILRKCIVHSYRVSNLFKIKGIDHEPNSFLHVHEMTITSYMHTET